MKTVHLKAMRKRLPVPENLRISFLQEEEDLLTVHESIGACYRLEDQVFEVPTDVVGINKFIWSDDEWNELREKELFGARSSVRQPAEVEGKSREFDAARARAVGVFVADRRQAFITEYTPITIRNFGNARRGPDLTDAKELDEVIDRYRRNARLPRRIRKWSFRIRYQNDIQGGGLFRNLRFFGSLGEAQTELRRVLQEIEDNYQAAGVSEISLRTLSGSAVLMGGSHDWVGIDGKTVVHYKSRTSCVLMALFLGKDRLDGDGMLATPKRWNQQLKNYKRRTLIPTLKKQGLDISNVRGITRDQIGPIAFVMDLCVNEFDIRGRKVNQYNPESKNVIEVLVHNGHCELMVDSDTLTIEEIQGLNRNREERSSYVRPRKRDQEVRGFIVADIEAYSSGEHLAYAIESVSTAGEVLSFTGTNSIDDWLDCLATTKPGERPETIYFHNGGNYDFFLLRRKLITHRGFRMGKREIADGSSMITFDIVNEYKARFVFLDSYRLLPTSLDKLTKELGVKHPKLKETVSFDEINRHFDELGFSDETIDSLYTKYPIGKYLNHDVLGLLEVLLEIQKIGMEKGVDITRCATVTSLSKAIYQTNYLRKYNIANLTNEDDLYVSKGVHTGNKDEGHDQTWILGGNCDARYIGEVGDCYFYDVTSLYPSVCVHDGDNGWLPTEPEGPVMEEGFVLESVFDFDNRFDRNRRYFVECLVVEDRPTNHPVHMMKAKVGKIWRNVNAVPKTWTRMVLYSEEIRYALTKQQYRYRVLSYQTYKAAPVFSDFMLDMYKAKATAKEDGKPALTLFCKLLLNAMTGAPGLNCNGRESVKLVHRNNISQFESAVLQDKLIDFERLGDYLSVHLTADIRKTFFNRALYAAITSKGRIEKNRFELQIVEAGGRVLYGDTDSVLSSIDCSSFPNVATGLLGGWENELPNADDKYTNGFIGGCKSYYLYNPRLAHGKTNPKVSQKGFHVRARVEPTCDENVDGRLNPEMLKYHNHGGPTQQEFRNYIETGSMEEPGANFLFRKGTKVAMGGFILRTEITDARKFTLDYKRGFKQEDGWIRQWWLEEGELLEPGVDKQWEPVEQVIEHIPPPEWRNRPMLDCGVYYRPLRLFKPIKHIVQVNSVMRGSKKVDYYWDNILGAMLFTNFETTREYAAKHDLQFFFRFGKYFYGAMQDEHEFRWLYADVPSEERFYHEIIDPDKPIRPYFDIDHYGEEDPEFLEKAIGWLQERWLAIGYGPLHRDDVKINASFGWFEKDGKRLYNNSWHVYICNGQVFENFDHLTDWKRAFFRGSPYDFDKNVYRRWGGMRIAKSRKETVEKCHLVAKGPLVFAGVHDMTGHMTLQQPLTFPPIPAGKMHPVWHSVCKRIHATPTSLYRRPFVDDTSVLYVKLDTDTCLNAGWSVEKIRSARLLFRPRRPEIVLQTEEIGRKTEKTIYPLSREEYHAGLPLMASGDLLAETAYDKGDILIHEQSNGSQPSREIQDKCQFEIKRPLKPCGGKIAYQLDEKSSSCPFAKRVHNHAFMRLIFDNQLKQWQIRCNNDDDCKAGRLVLT